jgi:hypothetical protein
VDAFARFGLRVTAIPFPNAKDWMRNALARSQYLESLARIHPHAPIGLLDSDVEPMQIPAALFNTEADFTGYDRGRDKPAHDRHIASVLIFGAGPAGRAILTDWAARCLQDAMPDQVLREQRYLNDAVESARSKGAKIVNLGNSYDRRPEQRRPGDDTILAHNPASRTLLHVIGGRR